jgi:hypothetical protein
MPTAEASAHVTAAEPTTVSTTATAATAARKCISGQSPCENRSHSQNNHGFAHH